MAHDDRQHLLEAVCRVGERWRDPEYEPRARAVERTLGGSNAFTEESIAYAVNQAVDRLRPGLLRAWLDGRWTTHGKRVAVVVDDPVPMAGFVDMLAVLLTGHAFHGARSAASPHLLPAFADDLRELVPSLDAVFGAEEEVLDAAEGVVARGDDEAAARLEAACDERGLGPARRLLQGWSYGAAVLDGRETEEELEGLAEDVLLYEGHGRRNVAVVWAPRGLSPDGLLDAFAHFRGVFPAHAGTPGALKMQQAFMAATGQPHAYGEGLEFLLSRGEPEPQSPGHLRWAEYDAAEEAAAWVDAHREELEVVVARRELAGVLGEGVPRAAPGDAHRPALGAAADVLAFLDRLAHEA